jgi:hypothetical protein
LLQRRPLDIADKGKCDVEVGRRYRFAVTGTGLITPVCDTDSVATLDHDSEKSANHFPGFFFRGANPSFSPGEALRRARPDDLSGSALAPLLPSALIALRSLSG